MKLKLVSFALCPYVQRARIVLAEKRIHYEIEFIDLDAPPSWFLDISPLEKVPVLMVDGQPLFESMAICEYIDEITPDSLHPPDVFRKAQNRAWIEFCNILLDATYTYFICQDELQFKQTRAKLSEWFEILEENITEHDYFNGSEFSMTDAIYAPLFRFYEVLNDYKVVKFFEDTPNVVAWWNQLLQRPSVINSVPKNYMSEMDNYIRKQDSIMSKMI